jgi:hypothetical protein
MVSKNDIPAFKSSMSYDKHNNLTSYAVNEATGKLLDNREYTYEYDTKGNWIKKTTIINGNPAFVLERQINYFEEQ